jgi:hypothetical protein
VWGCGSRVPIQKNFQYKSRRVIKACVYDLNSLMFEKGFVLKISFVKKPTSKAKFRKRSKSKKLLSVAKKKVEKGVKKFN